MIKKQRYVNISNVKRVNNAAREEIRKLEARNERGEGVTPRRSNRIIESATKESRGAKLGAI